jgi:CDP-diacylglycerol--serine O-phosphatidyltransferase
VTRRSNTHSVSKLDKRRKGIYILPNLFTTAGLFAGFFAIIQATVGHFDYAAVAIFVAMAMDTLDGRVARITSTASDFGKEYDSLADVIAFGVAPALVIYEWGLNAVGRLGWLIAFIFVAAAACSIQRPTNLR